MVLGRYFIFGYFGHLGKGFPKDASDVSARICSPAKTRLVLCGVKPKHGSACMDI